MNTRHVKCDKFVALVQRKVQPLEPNTILQENNPGHEVFATHSKNANSSLIKLPAVSIPCFSGDPADYIYVCNTFSSSIKTRTGVRTGVNNLWLVSCMRLSRIMLFLILLMYILIYGSLYSITTVWVNIITHFLTISSLEMAVMGSTRRV